jgi:hypothetical protein
VSWTTEASSIKKLPTPGRVYPDGGILEQCWDGTKTYYCKFWAWQPDIGQLKFEKCSECSDFLPGCALIPLEDDVLTKGIVLLPSEPMDYGKEVDLLALIQTFIHKWCEVEPEMERLLAGYVLLTWLYEKCPAMPIINIRGGAMTGKTRMLEIMRQVCYRGMRASGCLSFSAMFRTVERWGGTLCINEGDMKNSAETSETIKYLNERYEKGGSVWRTNPDTFKGEFFTAFGPTVLTTRQPFADNALESRCIIVPMKERTRTDILLNLPPAFFEEAKDLRNKLLMFRFKNFGKFENDYTLEFEGLSPRMNQILQPLASLAKKINDKFFEEVKGMAFELQQRVVEATSESADGLVVRAALDLEEHGQSEFTPKEISEAIAENGGEVKSVQVGKRLVALGLKLKRQGSKRLYSIPESMKVTLIRRFVPSDEPFRLISSDTSDGSDGKKGQVEDGNDEATKKAKRLILLNQMRSRDVSFDEINKWTSYEGMAAELRAEGSMYVDDKGICRLTEEG